MVVLIMLKNYYDVSNIIVTFGRLKNAQLTVWTYDKRFV